MNQIEFDKCGNCGSESISIVEDSYGIRITCDECGRELFIPNADRFLKTLYLQMIRTAGDIKENYIASCWNQFNSK